MIDIYCYADPEALTWEGYNNTGFKLNNKETKCHVAADKLDEYNEKFGHVNVTFVGDLTDGIESLTNDESKSHVIYDLSGQRINGFVEGINIVDGKKVLVK